MEIEGELRDNAAAMAENRKTSMKPPRDLASFISAYKEIKNEDASKISGRIRILTKISSIFSDKRKSPSEFKKSLKEGW